MYHRGYSDRRNAGSTLIRISISSETLPTIANQVRSRRNAALTVNVIGRPPATRWSAARRKKRRPKFAKLKKSWQHPKDFPSGPPPQYYPGPATVSFGVLKRSDVFVAVWPPAIHGSLRGTIPGRCHPPAKSVSPSSVGDISILDQSAGDTLGRKK